MTSEIKPLEILHINLVNLHESGIVSCMRFLANIQCMAAFLHILTEYHSCNSYAAVHKL